ncbi:MAG TPA: xanthine dehydrogenase family protein molybdopterin-binding subunit [Rhodopila sp.]|uniref:xanthine dehydrogenase family protein molybdopterin-binding subunit n=1 Tax=Rhodopila sp. TaxID=2480087 RepID=UPI002C642F7E|nr:xanthine dehydrogenase family protein molybdopterin-binding subunit [Rhodopila sp.]HVY18397.1 xanthine dehydrogenase family protein molybdopterin-binding subunit [Rhodopila sp.]
MSTIQAKSVRRREDLRLLTGRGNYTADARPGAMAVAVFLRSPYAHARITSIDTAAARALPGVFGVFTAADLTDVSPIPGGIGFPRPDGGPAPKTDRKLLAEDRVRFVGEPVAVVVADSRAAGLEAAEAILVDYDALPLVTDAAAAMAQGAPAVWDDVPDNIGFLWKRGDADGAAAALAGSAHVTTLDFCVSRVTANSMEPRGAWAEVAADGRLEVHASHQSPFALRNGMASGNFGCAPTDIRVVPGDVGGSFGMKSGVHLEPVLVAWAARRLGRPVRWVSDRTEGFLTDEQAREMRISASLGLDKDGRFTALKLRWDVNLGAYVSGRSGWGVGNIGGIAGVYVIPYIAAEVCGVLTHTVPTAAYRGAGRPEATYAIERLIDLAAREIGVSPYELRRRNLIPPSAMPYKTALTFTYDCGEFEGNMVMAAEMADLGGFPARRADAEARGKLRGIGLCNCIEVAGGPFLRPARDQASLRIAPDGTLVLRSGSMSVGQGLETTMTQLVAERFGVDIEQVRWEGGDTDLLPGGKGNGGSGALCIGGSAVMLAADKVIETARKVAAEILEAAVVDIEFSNGRFRIAGTDRSVGLAEVARAAPIMPGEEGGLTESGEFVPTAVTFPNGTHVCEVEIDKETGVTEIVRYSAVEELGRVLNPLIVTGQIQGGVVQGIGQALGEVIIHDKESGQMLTASFMDYQMPRAYEYPEFQLATREVPTAVNPIGAKGVGEAGTVGALGAAMNAINDALAPLGVRHFDMPATPARVWEAIRMASR